ncbi:hypothetical protein J2Y46_002666 [Microbacterium sp. BE35]|uniref:hypothetical protein n=1 Tax=Microbacterium sp. BE35 TaxID=2817773 RepID=UPI0028611E20|nr:hypothetical protein [Microbacterium sp. BE35]MDR7189840.1 hypothetical protein [Microbacterium sp. BE35]
MARTPHAETATARYRAARAEDGPPTSGLYRGNDIQTLRLIAFRGSRRSPLDRQRRRTTSLLGRDARGEQLAELTVDDFDVVDAIAAVRDVLIQATAYTALANLAPAWSHDFGPPAPRILCTTPRAPAGA